MEDASERRARRAPHLLRAHTRTTLGPRVAAAHSSFSRGSARRLALHRTCALHCARPARCRRAALRERWGAELLEGDWRCSPAWRLRLRSRARAPRRPSVRTGALRSLRIREHFGNSLETAGKCSSRVFICVELIQLTLQVLTLLTPLLVL